MTTSIEHYLRSPEARRFLRVHPIQKYQTRFDEDGLRTLRIVIDEAYHMGFEDGTINLYNIASYAVNSWPSWWNDSEEKDDVRRIACDAYELGVTDRQQGLPYPIGDKS